MDGGRKKDKIIKIFLAAAESGNLEELRKLLDKST